MILICSCASSVVQQDISLDTKYSTLINQKYQTKTVLNIYGITQDPNYKKKVDLYEVMLSPGVGGPEVVTHHLLQPNTIFSIKKVLMTKYLFNKCIEFQVEILDRPEYMGAKILLVRDQETKIVTLENNEIILNPVLYKKVIPIQTKSK